MIKLEDCRDWDIAVRQGRAGDVRKVLKSLNLSRIPRGVASHLANIARRCGLHTVSIRVLNPIVRAEKINRHPASPAELAEYGMALVNIGAVTEGRAILLEIAPHDFPQLPLLLAQSYLPEWKYHEAARVLEPFVAARESDPYLKLVAQVNLCAAYLYERQYAAAEILVAETLLLAEKENLFLLRGNLLEIRGQLLLEEKRFAEARESVMAAHTLVKNMGTTDELYVNKWSCLIDLYEKPESRSAVKGLREIQAQALEQKSWETYRDLDRHLAITQKDVALYHHLFYGSPYLEYRQRLVAALPSLEKPPASYTWRLQTEARSSKGGTFNVDALQFNGKSIGLKQGQLLHRLILLLASDFYRAFPTASLSSRLFPGEYYNQITSPNRVHQLVKRLREIFSEKKIALEIQEADGAYRFASRETIDLRIQFCEDPVQQTTSIDFKLDAQLAKLEQSARTQDFSAKQAADWLEVSLSTATRLLRLAAENQRLEKTGSGPKTHFRFARAQSRAA